MRRRGPKLASRIVKQKKERQRQFVEGDSALIEAVAKHLEQHLGPMENVVHEVSSPHVHIDLYNWPPTAERPYRVLVTCGMSEKSMVVPKSVQNRENYQFGELVLALPPDWPFDSEAWNNNEFWWPVGQLKYLARYPHAYGTWLWYGHSMPNGEPAQPFAQNTEFNGVVLLEPVLLPETAQMLCHGGNHIFFWGVYPVFEEEMNLKLRAGAEELERLLHEHNVTELVDVRRSNVVTGRRFLLT